MIKREDFSIITAQKGKTYNGRKITNNSNHIILYKSQFVGEVHTKRDAERFINNLCQHQKTTYTHNYI